MHEGPRSSGKFKNIVLAVTIFAGLIFWFSLKREKSEVQDTEEVNAPEVTQQAKQLPPDVMAITKNLNEVTKCMNRHSDRIIDSYLRYASWADIASGPTGRERNIYGLYEIYDTGDCIRKLSAEGELNLNKELRNVASDYVKAIADLEPVLDETYQYYDHKDYMDDKMAKGKELHGQLIPLFHSFLEVDKLFREKVNKEVELLSPQLPAPKTTDEELRYKSLNTLEIGKAAAQIALTSRDWNLVPVDQFISLVDSFSNSLKDLDQFISSNAFESIHELSGKNLLDSGDEYLKEAKAYMRRVRDKTPYSGYKKQWVGTNLEMTVDGSLGKMLDKYNRFADTYNRIELYNEDWLVLPNETHFYLDHPEL